ncbi:MAG TPA: 16S rRNA (guanine(966)-N(2))-methyltransferase RsmD [Syntrophorhabdales bacterium]|nr:16S rRNA (guanine(966)-N(2))-methyltransferase RsmD [Syntrophorhabdales bacterium]
MGELRVTGGILKGRKILVPDRGEARYTSSKVRAAIFNLIGDVADYDVLDLFAGSGCLAIEALSRGAKRAVCVEKAGRMAEMLRENLRRLGLDKDCVVLNMDVIYALSALSKRGDRYDLILMDPPYELGYVSATLDVLSKQTVCRDESLLVLEHSKREQLPGFLEPGNVKNRLYGDTAVSLIRCGTYQR